MCYEIKTERVRYLKDVDLGLSIKSKIVLHQLNKMQVIMSIQTVVSLKNH